MNLLKFLVLFLSLNAFGLTADPGFSGDLSGLEARSYSKRQERRRKKNFNKNSQKSSKIHEKPSLVTGELIEKPNQFFFRTDIGLGFLYFKQARANLGVIPTALNDFSTSNSPFEGPLSYNRTPLYEYQLGYRFCSFLSAGLSYMHQGNISVQSARISSSAQVFAGNLSNNFNQLRANLALDTVMLKFYAELPWSIMWRKALASLYLGTGVGIGWQSWTSIQLNSSIENFTYFTLCYDLKQKIVTNATWTADVGIRLQPSDPEKTFNLLGGCKFNIWGQATNVGQRSKQGSFKYGLNRPLRIKTIYQWAPYLGLQWNFPSHNRLAVKRESEMELSPLFAQMNAGVGLLYFKKVAGNLVGNPNQNGNSGDGWQSASVTQKVSYNRTPLFEYLVQQRIGSYFQFGLSYQTQSGVTVQTEAVGARSSMIASYARFVSYLSLNGILAKGYVKVPLSSFYHNVQITPYFGLGFGPGWQTWNNSEVNKTGVARPTNPIIFASNQPIRQKVIANPVLNLDLGLEILRKNPWQSFSMLAGCKFNYWGQVRNIGLLSEQGFSSIGIQRAFRIKKLYQWAPYLGVQWNFPYHYSKKSYFLDGKDPNTWCPYVIPLNMLQENQQYFAQFNAAIGFLYFSGVRGNLSPSPTLSYRNLSQSAPLKGRLTYNRSPLFEYVFGYHLCQGVDIALSYQHQGNITVQTQVVQNDAPAATTNYHDQRSQLSADLILDAVMLKAQYELQRALIFKNLAYSPYCGIGLGPTWQTWKRVGVDQPLTFLGYYDDSLTSLRQKICANVGFMLDWGVRMRSPFPEIGFSASLGLKFNVWGQARNIGDLRQANSPTYGLNHPFRIRTIYQWAPYLGIQWNF